jgi:hypothetical protein
LRVNALRQQQSCHRRKAANRNILHIYIPRALPLPFAADLREYLDLKYNALYFAKASAIPPGQEPHRL